MKFSASHLISGRPELIKVIVIALILSIPILLLTEGVWSFILFSFETILIITLYGVCVVKKQSIVSFESIKIRVHSVALVDWFFVAASVVLLFLNFTVAFDVYKVVLGLILTSFLPGYVLLNLLRFKNSYSIIETIILSYALSIVTTGFISVPLLQIDQTQRAMVTCFLYLGLSVIPLVRNIFFKQKVSSLQPQQRMPKTRLSELMLLIFILLFVLFCVSAYYPQSPYALGFDINRHYVQSLIIFRTPDLYAAPYPLFHLHQGIVLLLSNGSVPVFQTAFAFMSVVVVLSFYIMANMYVRKMNWRLPILSTLFWSLFSGFGWLYFAATKVGSFILNSGASNMDLLNAAYDASYFDAALGQASLWLWYRPITAGFAIFFSVLYLLKRNDLPKRSFAVILSLLVMAMGLVYLPTLIVFLAVLVFLSIFKLTSEIRLDKALLSSLFGYVGIAIIHSLFFRSVFFYIYAYLIVMAIITSITLLLRHKKTFLRLPNKFLSKIAPVIPFIFVGELLIWFSSAASFSYTDVYSSGFVPSMLFPVILGISGLLCTMSFSFILKNRGYPTLTIFLALFFVSVVIGITMAFVTVNIVDTGYSERKLMPFIYAATSMLAPFALLKIINRQNTLPASFRQKALTSFFVGIIVLCGFTSTILAAYYYSPQNSENSIQLSGEAFESMSYLSQLISENPTSPVYSVTSQSRSESIFSTSPMSEKFVSDIRSDLLWSSKNPETSLAVLYDTKYSNPYIYLQPRDYSALQTTYKNGYMSGHLVQLLPEVYNDGVASIVNALNGVPPSPNSDLILVTPVEDDVEEYFFATDLLSLGNYNFTTMLESDELILDGQVVIFPYDNHTAEELAKYVDTSNRTVIVLNLAGNGPLANDMFKAATPFLFNSNATLSLVGTQSGSSLSGTASGAVDLIVRNELSEHSPSILVEDQQTSFWGPSSAGVGAIGLPILSNDGSSKVTGSDGLAINVGSGSSSVWGLTHSYEQSQDWSDYDFLTFYWFGRNDSAKYVLNFFSPDSANRFRIEFADTWSGWKKVILPLDASTGQYTLNGVTFEMTVYGDASWSSVCRVDFGLSTSNPNLVGEWFLDQFGLDLGRWFDIEGEFPENIDVDQFQLYNYDGENYIPIDVSLDEPTFTSFYFMDGSYSGDIFETSYTLEVSLEKGVADTKLNMSLLLPPIEPDSNELDLLSAWFKLNFNAGACNVTRIIAADSELMLPSAVSVAPMQSADDVVALSWYRTDSFSLSPYATSKTIGSGELIYLNIYPLIQAINVEKNHELISIFGELLKIPDLSLPEYTNQNQWIDGTFISFTKAELSGDISVISPSIIMPSNNANLEITIKDQSSASTITPVSSIEIKGANNLKLSAKQLTVNEGKGYYALLSLWQPVFTVTGDSAEITVITGDGEIVTVILTPDVELTLNGQFEAYFRMPSITVYGEVTFEDAYASGSILKWLQARGNKLTIKGNERFEIITSDTFTVAQVLSIPYPWSHTTQMQPSKLVWDELSNQIVGLPLLVACIGLGVWFKILKKKSIKKNKKLSNIA